MTKEMFFSYLLECYVAYKGKITGYVLIEWDDHGIT